MLHGDRLKEQPGSRSFSSCLRKSPAGSGPRLSRSLGRRSVRVAPMVQILDALVPQMVDNPMDAFELLDLPIAEQVIAVPNVSC